MTTIITHVPDLAPFENDIEEMAVDWADPDTGRIAWEDFLTRVEKYLHLDLPAEWDDPVVRRIQSIARAAVREASL